VDIGRYRREGEEIEMKDAPGSIADAIAELRASSKFREWKPSYSTPVTQTPGIEKSNLLKDERHFTPQELSELWNVSVQTIRAIFQREEGVLKIGRDGTRSRRRYKTIRIPESVADRVHTRLSA
jgi:hypothetical protein